MAKKDKNGQHPLKEETKPKEEAQTNKEDQKDQLSLKEEIQTNEEDTDLSYRDEMRSMQRDSEIQRLNQRITLLSIVAPCLLFAILAFAYFDLANRLNKTRSVGSKEVQTLSEEVVDNIASLSQRHGELEKSLIAGVSRLKKSSVSIKKDLTRNKQEIKKLNVSKIDKAEVAKTLAELRNELQKQQQPLEDMSRGLKKDVAGIAKLVKTMQNQRKKQASVVKALSDRKVDKEDVDNLRTSYQKRTDLLQNKIESMKKEIAQLRKQVKSAAGSGPKKARPKAKPAPKPKKVAPTPVPPRIIEQDVTE